MAHEILNAHPLKLYFDALEKLKKNQKINERYSVLVKESQSRATYLVAITISDDEDGQRPVAVRAAEERKLSITQWLASIEKRLLEHRTTVENPIEVLETAFVLDAELRQKENWGKLFNQTLLSQIKNLTDNDMLEHYVKTQALNMDLSSNSVLIALYQAPQAGILKKETEWARERAHLKDNARAIILQDKKKLDGIECYYDKTHTTKGTCRESENRNMIDYMEAIVGAIGVRLSHYKKGHDDGKTIFYDAYENRLIVNLRVKENVMFLLVSEFVAVKITENIHNLPDLMKKSISKIAAMLLTEREGIDVPSREFKVIRQKLKTLSIKERAKVLEFSRQLANEIAKRASGKLDEISDETTRSVRSDGENENNGAPG